MILPLPSAGESFNEYVGRVFNDTEESLYTEIGDLKEIRDMLALWIDKADLQKYSRSAEAIGRAIEAIDAEIADLKESL